MSTPHSVSATWNRGRLSRLRHSAAPGRASSSGVTGLSWSAVVCRNELWLWSMSPSSACSQLQNCTRFLASTCSSGSMFHSRSGRGGGSLLAAHVDPDDAPALAAAVRLLAHLRAERRLHRLVGHVDALAGGVVLPAVIDAPEPRFLVASEEQVRAAVRAVGPEHAHAPVGVAERDEVLAQQADAQRIAVGARAPARAAPVSSTAASARPSSSPVRPSSAIHCPLQTACPAPPPAMRSPLHLLQGPTIAHSRTSRARRGAVFLARRPRARQLRSFITLLKGRKDLDGLQSMEASASDAMLSYRVRASSWHWHRRIEGEYAHASFH